MKLNYTRTGDYLIPNLVINEPDEVPGSTECFANRT